MPSGKNLLAEHLREAGFNTSLPAVLKACCCTQQKLARAGSELRVQQGQARSESPCTRPSVFAQRDKAARGSLLPLQNALHPLWTCVFSSVPAGAAAKAKAHNRCLAPARAAQRQRTRGPCANATRSMQALEDEKCHNLALYAGCYQLFMAWAPGRSHPWDALPAAEQAAAVLEVGGAPDGSGKVTGVPSQSAVQEFEGNCASNSCTALL